jgi:hypothetical protein
MRPGRKIYQTNKDHKSYVYHRSVHLTNSSIPYSRLELVQKVITEIPTVA